jgi:hypothetical protein|tara:strand:+ start:364 stop:801 length:438 start_codon:yes stop_codon:yes gene_type:complete
VSLVDSLVVEGTVFVKHGVVHCLHVRLSANLTVLHTLELTLQLSQMRIFLHSNHIFDPLLFLLDLIELASVPVLDTVPIALNIVRGSRPHVVKDAPVLVLDKFLSHAQVLMTIHLLIFKIVHVLHKLVPSLHVLDSFICLLFLLL